MSGPQEPATTPDDYADAGGDAPLVTPGSTSRVGDREPGDPDGDGDDIGSTDAMTSSTGGLAGTSR